MICYLMRKNEKVMFVDISPTGHINKLGKVFSPEMVPLQNRTSQNGIITWWEDRAIPITQGKVQAMLQEKGISTTGLFLTKNLGLSLTDYYWIKPVSSDLTWEQVNLFENDFKDNLLLGQINLHEKDEMLNYTPNSSLQGNLEKTWIIENNVRKLIKGNHDNLSSESINEIIIADAIEKQKREHAFYDLIRITGKPYDFGSITPLFTSLSLELISAYAVITSQIKENHMSTYEHFISICEKNGLDRDKVREFLEFEIMLDFVFSNRDRHLTNISVLRDADTMQFVSMAPIYDNGKSMFVGKDIVPVTNKRMLSIETNGFKNTELDLMKLVENRSLIDIQKLPSASDIRQKYEQDTQLSKERIHFILETYERKLDLLYQFQNGKDLKALKYSTVIPVREGRI